MYPKYCFMKNMIYVVKKVACLFISCLFIYFANPFNYSENVRKLDLPF